jgi:anaerobic selenocysteine-containing dehydrogenase
MTNHWTDIDNTSLIFAYGANPAENHPACMAHVNAARFGAKNARLIVVDPRLTRTARQCDPARGDFHVRIRPGTNVAFTNGLLKWIFDHVADYRSDVSDNMLAWHNGTAGNSTVGRGFITDTGTPKTPDMTTATYDGTTHPMATGYPKYCDTRFVVNDNGDDYQRAVLTQGTDTYSNFPVIATTVADKVGGRDTVWTSLKKHLAPYDTATVADICGCTEAEIIAVAQALIDNCRFASNDFGAATATPNDPRYKATTILYAMGQTQHTNGSQNIKDLAILQTIMGNMGRPGGGINALRGIHNVQGSTDFGALFDSIPGYSGNPAVDEHYSHYQNTLFGNRIEGAGAVNYNATTSPRFLDASKLGLQQRGFHNMTNEWFGTGTSTGADVEKLYDLWPKGNGAQHVITFRRMVDTAVKAAKLTVVAAANPPANSAVTFTAVNAGDKGNGISIEYASGPDDAHGTSASVAGNAIVVTLAKTGTGGTFISSAADVKTAVDGVAAALVATMVDGDGSGLVAVKAPAYLSGGVDRIKATVVWGQNPAVTEPNQAAVRTGLRNLDLLVVVDMFETETAAVDRKPGAPTYLIPACSHVEEAGSVTNSGRWIQWRERACAPKGNSKADLELLLRFAYALDQAGAFSHIVDVWTNDLTTAIPRSVAGHAYAELFGRYGWTPTDAKAFEDQSVNTEMWPARGVDGVAVTAPVTKLVWGSEVTAEAVFKEIASPLNHDSRTGLFSTLTGGTMWIYSGSGTAADPEVSGQAGYNPGSFVNALPAVTFDGNPVPWQTKNRAKSRNNVANGNNGNANLNNANNYPRWGWAWLLNRRVFYNNGEVAGDQTDNFVSPGYVSCLFTMNAAGNALADWSGPLAYRKYKTFADAPESGLAKTGANRSPHYIADNKTFMGRFPGHTEPYESPAVASNPAFAADYVALFGHNTSGGSRLLVDEVVKGDGGTPVGSYGTAPDRFPLVLTSIRCVEHFQGGPITRNNSWNLEAEPVPWIEINSTDARKYGISDGDWVNVTTARSNSTSEQEGRSPNSALPAGAHWARGFKARVGVGLQSNQRVAPGVVAIPWHWGDKGLGTGSRANDLCIDAWDANTMIPEYKACLCKIEKI